MPGIRPDSSGPVCAVTAWRTSTRRVGGLGFSASVGSRFGAPSSGRRGRRRSRAWPPRYRSRHPVRSLAMTDVHLSAERAARDDSRSRARRRARGAASRARARSTAAATRSPTSVARWPRVPRRVGAARRARTRRRRGVRVLPRRLPPRPRPAAPVGLARLGLRALAQRDEPRLPACARRPAQARPRRSASATRRSAAPSSCASWTPSTHPAASSVIAVSGSATPRGVHRETRADHRYHRPGRPLPLAVPADQGLPGVRARARPGEPEDRDGAEPRTPRSSSSKATCATSRRSSASMEQVQPDEVYNLGAISFVQLSFKQAELTAEITGLGVLRMLEAVRIVGGTENNPIRFYQASSSEMFGKVQRDSADRGHAVPPALAVRRRQGVRPLHDAQLPRGVRHPREQRHPVQPRRAAPRARVRHPQGDQLGRAHQARAAGSDHASATSTRRATGATRATTSRRCG